MDAVLQIGFVQEDCFVAPNPGGFLIPTINERLNELRVSLQWGLLRKLNSKSSRSFCRPERVAFEVTRRCNSTCAMCHRHNLDEFGDMDLETFKKVVSQIKGAKTLIAFGLGEPLLNPALPEMIEYAHEHGIPELTFTTNGIALRGDLLKRIAKLPLTEISCSIHSPDPEIHAQIVPGADITKILPNLKWLKENSDIKVKINTVMMKLNYESVFRMPKLIADYGFDRWDFYMVRGITRFAKEQELPRTQEFATELYNKMKKLCDEHGVNIVESYPSTFWNKCYAPFFDAYVNYKGELAPCCTLPEIGLEKVESLRRAWNGKPMRKWRKALMNDKPPHRFCQEICLKYLK